MPRIVTTFHDPVALAATCRQLGLAPPVEHSVRLNGEEVFGWEVRLPGLHRAIVCDLLSGLIAYHPRDNVHARYVHIIGFLRHCYDTQFRRQQPGAACAADTAVVVAPPSLTCSEGGSHGAR